MLFFAFYLVFEAGFFVFDRGFFVYNLSWSQIDNHLASVSLLLRFQAYTTRSSISIGY